MKREALAVALDSWPKGRSIPRACVMDGVFQRYGWDYHTFQAQPEWLIEELMMVLAAESEAAEIKKGKGSTENRSLAQAHESAMVQANKAGLIGSGQYESAMREAF